jgi:microcystin degradation protein MlrC
MRVGIIALLHESNTFIAEPTTLKYFEENWLLVGEAFRERAVGTHHETGGFFEGLEQQQIDAVPIFAGRAMPYGAITAETFDSLLETMFSELDGAGQLDGILVAPHGATVSEEHPDADGYWLAELRRRVGDQMPIIGTLDAHANLSPLMIDSTNALIAYRSNPHLDQRARGIEAANLMARTLRGEVKATQVASFPPVAINIERQLTTEPHLVPLYELADEMLNEPGMLSNSILLGFPYADVAEMGSSAIAVTNDSPQLAQEHADRLGDYLWDHREEFAGQMISIDEALQRSASLDGPICLLDMGDNVGGGSPADSTHLAHAIRAHQWPDASRSFFICIYDPESVEQAHLAGPGEEISMRVGGKTDDMHGPPFEADFVVIGLYDGKFTESQPRHGGMMKGDQGRTAILWTAGGLNLTVMVTSRRMPPFSLQQLISCGLAPEKYDVLVAKGVNAPVAAYEPICKHLIRVNTPGCTTADMTMLDFKHRRRPMFPFEGRA